MPTLWPAKPMGRERQVVMMIPAEVLAEIRRLYYAEHWKVGTIATELGLRKVSTTLRQ
jgi:DNA-binding transcriptional regulator LsrR (DeoR family)